MDETFTPKTTAEQEERKRQRARELGQFLRDALLLGTPADALSQALIRHGDQADLVEELVRNFRESIQRQAKVDAGLEVANTLTRLEILYAAMMTDRDYLGALAVVRERARFTRAANLLTYAREGDLKKSNPTEFDIAFEEIGSAEREELSLELRRRAIARAEELRAIKAREKDRLAQKKKEMT